MFPKMNIFAEAKTLSSKIELEGIGRGNEYYCLQFKKSVMNLTLCRTAEGTKIKCTCKHCSVHDNEYLCRYKIALILYLSEKK